jgi:hypothetical protein
VLPALTVPLLFNCFSCDFVADVLIDEDRREVKYVVPAEQWSIWNTV